MAHESKPAGSLESNVPAWQTAMWRSGDREIIRRFNLKDPDGSRNLRDMLIWASRSKTTVILVPEYIEPADAAEHLAKYSAVL